MSISLFPPEIAAITVCYLSDDDEPKRQEFERLFSEIANSQNYVAHLVSHDQNFSSLSVQQINSLPSIGEKVQRTVSRVLSSCARREISSAQEMEIPDPVTQTTLFRIRADLRNQIFELNLSYSNISDADLDILTREMPHLTRLDLHDNNNITNLGIGYVSRLTHLQSLDLRFCEGITYDVIIPTIFNYCPNLKNLQLERFNEDMRNEDLLPIAEQDRPNLLSLGLIGHILIGDEAILAIASRCPNLEELTTSCGLSGRTIRFLAEHCPKLEVLDISNCQLENDTAIRFLLEHCPRLRKLRCCNMDEIDYDWIEANYPHLHLELE